MSEPTKEALAAVSDQYKDLPETARSCAVVSRAREIDDITHLPELLAVVEAARNAYRWLSNPSDYRWLSNPSEDGRAWDMSRQLSDALAALDAAKGEQDE